MNKMIKAIIFDLGGVFLNMQPLTDEAEGLFKPKDKKEFWHELNIQIIPLCLGKISVYEFWKKLAFKYHSHINHEILKNLWIKDYAEKTFIDKKVEKIILDLKKNYKLGLISNTIFEHVEINKNLGRYKLFDQVILSNEVGLTKNNKKIFLLACKRLEVKPAECIFIDDIEDFCKIAESVGMKTIVFKSADQLNKDLKKLLQKEPLILSSWPKNE